MSREILFRGQMRKKGEKVNLADEPIEGIWVYGGIFAASSNSDRCIITSYDDLKKYPVHADTVGQYTGLHDNTYWDDLSEEEKEDWLKHHTKDEWNGRKIFEGDILRAKNKIPYVVSYSDDVAGFVAKGDVILLVAHMANAIKRSYEIIGNIYDNPELLEAE